MKVFCHKCDEFTNPSYNGNTIIMKCSKCKIKYDFSMVDVERMKG